MFQDIYPKKFNNAYDPSAVICDDDYVLIYDKGESVFKNSEHEFFKYFDVKQLFGNKKFTYLFSIDNDRFFLCVGADVSQYKVRMKNVKLRYFEPQWVGFAAACGASLAFWYRRSQYCGVCGKRMYHSKTERAMVCPQCNNTIYPQIAPAVIVALIHDNKILLTKYAHGPYKRYALIAGYTEIGETVEETVVREVMEEVGIKAKNLKYYGSQPWPFSGSVLMGYTAEVDGDDKIQLDTNELCVGIWQKREDVEADENPKSLTNQMIRDFKEGRI